MRRKPIYVAVVATVLALVGLGAFAHHRSSEADRLVEAARARFGVSLAEAPELDRIQGSTATSYLERARELGRDDQELRMLRHYGEALTHLARGDLVFAEGELTAARHADGWTPDLRVLAAEIARRLTDYDAANGHVAEALASDPDHTRALLMRADLALDQGDHASALLDLEVLREREPEASVVRNRLGVALLALDRFDAARIELREAMRLSEASPDPWINLGRLERRVGDHRAAFEAFDGAIALSAGDPDAHLGRGLARAVLGELREAEGDFRRAAELAPNDAEPLLALGDLLRDLGQVDDAISVYREALAREDGDAASWLKLGNALVLDGQPGLASRAFVEAIERAPGLAAAHNGLGASLMQLGRADEAAAALSRAAEIDAEDPNPLMNLALLREREGDRDGARSAWEAALARDPSLAIARERL
jgi:tetratricopeptide (TPR) repeat protein